jgi:DNA repair protein RadD
MSAPTLRDYQNNGVTAIRAEFARGMKRVLYTAPTGSGKTVLFSYIVESAAQKGRRVIIVGHRQEIIDQIDEALDRLGLDHGIIAASRPDRLKIGSPVQVASVATLARRIEMFGEPDLLVIDEAHHALANTWLRIIAASPRAAILGVTATPERLDGKGLCDVFETLVLGPSVADLIKQGFLSEFAAFAPEKTVDLSDVRTRAGDFALEQLSDKMTARVVIGSAVDDYKKRCDGLPAIVFCVDIGHSRLVAERFCQHGYRAMHVDGDTPSDQRRNIIDGLSDGRLQVVTNCGLISEGVDVPVVAGIIMLRPTQSLALHMQQIGRGLRPGKERAYILDHAGNCYRHGLPDAEHEWSLDGREKKKKEDKANVRFCKACGALNPMAAWECRECGSTLRQKKQYIEQVMTPLNEISFNDLATVDFGRAMRWAGMSQERLLIVAKARGYKKGWVWHRLREMREKMERMERR